MLEVQSLGKTFEGHPVLKEINLVVETSQIVAIMGSSGGGKTTLLRCISGLIVPTQGKVLLDGTDVQVDPEKARSQMGMVFQSAALFDFMNVTDNVVFGLERQLKLTPDERRRVSSAALERVGMGAGDMQKMPSDLSGGMRKRVGVARALALSPKLMLYDEPTTGLDPITTYNLDRLIVELRNETGVTSLLVSHDVSSVMRVADRVAFLHQGTLVFYGSPAEFEISQHPAIRELIDKARATKFDGPI